MFIEDSLTIAKTWKQPRHPLVGEWINKHCLVHPNNGILFSAKMK